MSEATSTYSEREVALFEEMSKVRDDGSVNMLDRNGAMVIANRLDCYKLVVHLGSFDESSGGRLTTKGRHDYMNFLNRYGEWLGGQE